MTHDQTTPAPVEVTQADRDRAAKFISESDGDFAELAALFAAHRIDSAPTGEVDPVWIEYTSPDGDQVAVVRPGNNDSEFPYWDQRPLYAHPPAPADLVELVTILHQYRSDMLRPPAPDSRERRVAMIDAAIAKFGRDA